MQEAAIQNRDETHGLSFGRTARKSTQWLMPVLWIGTAFGAAGTLQWTRGWVVVAVSLICMIALQAYVKRRNPVLLEVRKKWKQPGTKRFDKILLSLYLPLTFVQPAAGGLDTVRFHSSSMPPWTLYAGGLGFALSVALVGWAMAENPHAEPTVRIQTDRNHRVVRTGPYRFVRHPMYAGAIPMYPATALMLGSWWAMGIALLIVILLVWRTALEDRVLQAELPGYREFAEYTSYRLLPWVW